MRVGVVLRLVVARCCGVQLAVGLYATGSRQGLRPMASEAFHVIVEVFLLPRMR